MGLGNNTRPPPFPPGTHLSKYFKVEALVRLSEGRMFYLLNDDRPDQETRKCWHCGHEESALNSSACDQCELEWDPDLRFLMSVRWDRTTYDPYKRFFDKGLEHPGIRPPEDVFFHDGLLCSVVPYRGEALLLDESAPFPVRRILHLAQRFAGLVAFTHYHGISLSGLTRANFLYDKGTDRFYLFDPEVTAVFDEQVPEHLRSQEIQVLARMLRQFTPVNINALRDFLEQTEQGAYASPLEFGRAVEGLFDTLDAPPPPTGMAAMTDVGLARVLNEDNWSWVQLGFNAHLYVVADGMGGHECGEVASDVAVQTICRESRNRYQKVVNHDVETLEQILDTSFQVANNTVKAYAEERKNDMGTTLVALMVSGRTGLMANVGDSRGYLVRDQTLHQVSRDHSLVAKMVEQHRITAEEARTHPHSNILLRTVGTERDVDIDIFRLELERGDKILLCSDGLWGEIGDEDIEAIMNQFDDPRVCARELVRAAHHGGGKDNVTLMLVAVDR